MDQALTTGQADDLERLIDRHGIENVLRVISMIANEKAAHVDHMWQDGLLAKRWTALALRLDQAADRCHGL